MIVVIKGAPRENTSNGIVLKLQYVVSNVERSVQTKDPPPLLKKGIQKCTVNVP